VYVLDDEDPFEVPLANIVVGDAEKAGISVLAHDSIPTGAEATFTSEVEKIANSGAQAVFLAGGEGKGTVALWRALNAAMPNTLLFGSATSVGESFASEIGAAGANTYLMTPVLPISHYPPSAQGVLRRSRKVFGSEAGPYALYGYEAMTLVLNAIRAAGARGNDRQTVIDRVLATRNRNSVIGRYSIEADGETTLSDFGVERIAHGHAVFYRAIHVEPGEG